MFYKSLIKDLEKRLFSYDLKELHIKYYYSLGLALEKKIIQENFNAAQAVFMIGSSSAMVFKEAKKRGLITIKEQIIAPPQYTLSVMGDVWEKYPDWENSQEERDILQFWADLQWKEWEYADHIVCGSSFVVEAIRQSGGSAEKAVVVPYGIPAIVNKNQVPKSYEGNRKLHVLTVGTLGLRKGTPYILEAAQKLQNECEFILVGALPTSQPRLLRNSPANVRLVGHIPRSLIDSYYQWADIFLLPSLSEGSATVCYEALSYGLPLIVTPNTGQFITNGEEGFIINSKSTEEIIEAISKFLQESHLVQRMSVKALKLSTQASFEAYEQRLIDFIKNKCL